LHDRENSVKALLHHQHQTFEELGRCRFDDLWSEFSSLDKRGHVSKESVYAGLGKRFGFDDLLQGLLTDNFYASYVRFTYGFPGMSEVLNEIRRARKTAIVTNGTVKMQEGKIVALGLDGLVDVVTISEAVQVRKPDPRIYQLALEALGISADRAVFVGDHPEADVAGAKRAGLRAIWFRDLYWGECDCADGTVNTLNELPAEILRLERI
jgi:putative hydrolase of the HAD superfamily